MSFVHLLPSLSLHLFLSLCTLYSILSFYVSLSIHLVLISNSLCSSLYIKAFSVFSLLKDTHTFWRQSYRFYLYPFRITLFPEILCWCIPYHLSSEQSQYFSSRNRNCCNIRSESNYGLASTTTMFNQNILLAPMSGKRSFEPFTKLWYKKCVFFVSNFDICSLWPFGFVRSTKSWVNFILEIN